MRFKHILFITYFYLVYFCANSQQSNDAGMWATLSIQHPLTKKNKFRFRPRASFKRKLSTYQFILHKHWN